MKKLLVVFLTLSMLFSLTGCCLKHDMAPATCTEPSTCTKCGKTEGSPLGHTEELMEDVAPACTEPGSKGGVHCAVCGEILTAPEVIEPTGHDFAEATYYKPQTCRICGAEEGEALGNKIFEKALFISSDAVKAMLNAEEETDAADAAEEVSKAAEEAEAAELTAAEPAEKKDYRRTVNVSAQSEGFEDLDMILALLGLQIKIDNNLDGRFALNAGLNMMGSDLFTLIVSAEEDGLNLSIPDFSDSVYVLSKDLINEVIETVAPILEAAASAKPEEVRSFSKEAMLSSICTEENLELINKYCKILVSVANEKTVTEAEEDYALAALGETAHCNVVTVAPTAEDWKAMLTELFTTAKDDEDLKTLLGLILSVNYKTSSEKYLYASEDEFAAAKLEEIYAAIDEALEKVDETAEKLALFALRFATADGRAYALKAFNEESGIGLESFGKAAEGGRRDVLVIYNPEDAIVLAQHDLVLEEDLFKDEALIHGVVNGEDLKVSNEVLSPVTGDRQNTEFTTKIDFGTGSVTLSNQHAEDAENTFTAELKTEKNSAALTVESVGTVEGMKLPSGEKVMISTMEELMEFVSMLVGSFSSSPMVEE